MRTSNCDVKAQGRRAGADSDSEQYFGLCVSSWSYAQGREVSVLRSRTGRFGLTLKDGTFLFVHGVHKRQITDGWIASSLSHPSCNNYGGRRRHRNFELSLENIWYGRVALFFKMIVLTDDNEFKDAECAMFSSIMQSAGQMCTHFQHNKNMCTYFMIVHSVHSVHIKNCAH
jgi:hypothetical protein